jgi:MFS family permease
MVLPSTTAFFTGTVIAGAGFGAAFIGSVRSLVPLATPHERAALMSGYFVVSYLAFSLPAIVAGVLVGRFGLHDTSIGFGLTLTAMAAAALLAMAAQRIA